MVLGTCLEQLGLRGSAGGEELRASGKKGKHVRMSNKRRRNAAVPMFVWIVSAMTVTKVVEGCVYIRRRYYGILLRVCLLYTSPSPRD